jgi:3,4-dihydroxy 2-butanone 4-phosphate synthase / GTP cyclohydrolase II
MIASTIERIRAHLRSAGVTKKGLAEKAGLHPNTLQGVEAPDWNPTASTLLALERHLPSEDEAVELPKVA